MHAQVLMTTISYWFQINDEVKAIKAIGRFKHVANNF